MDIGYRLRSLREQKKLSQGEVEKRTGLVRSYISRVENGHTVPSVATMEKWHAHLRFRFISFFTMVRSHLPPQIVARATVGRRMGYRASDISTCLSLSVIRASDWHSLFTKRLTDRVCHAPAGLRPARATVASACRRAATAENGDGRFDRAGSGRANRAKEHRCAKPREFRSAPLAHRAKADLDRRNVAWE